ncbi:MAG: HD domain-containing protein [Verrucomicrobia bacterium]|nr:HD domain-containing protein [Verrucomicrobiota bacterium]
MFAYVDTRNPQAVEEQARLTYLRLFPDADPSFITQSFDWARQCFSGQVGEYLPIDARYHDFEHTLQGTLCLIRLLEGRHLAHAKPLVDQHRFNLVLLAILFHDTGYLKRRDDTDGTGAKYTLTHVVRSADFARDFLSSRGFSASDIEAIRNMISCTGVNANLQAIPFRDDLERTLGYALATADLLGQMAAPDYVEKLPILYQEFAEAVRHDGPKAGRLASYRDADELARNTPSFWQNYVLPKINSDFDKLYQFLSVPYPHGTNSYVAAIEKNLARIGDALARSP